MQLNPLTLSRQQRIGTPAPAPAANSDAATVAVRIAELDAQLKPLYAISTAQRDLLTRARADAVQQGLLGNTTLSTERVYLTARSNEGQSPADGAHGPVAGMMG